jgi:hypothetical protein
MCIKQIACIINTMKKPIVIPPVDEKPISYKHVLDRAVLVYGASGSGKSVVIVDMLNSLKPYADQIIVFAPTDKQNQTYSSGIVPLPFIHYDVTPEILKTIWDRQEVLATVYKQANELRTLERLYARCPRKDDTAMIDKMVQIAARCKKEIKDQCLPEGQCKVSCEKVDRDLIEFKKKVYKNCIERNRKALQAMKLDETEGASLRYHNMNPKLVMIFDDCTDLIQKYRKDETVQKIFYQGRHQHITAIIALHTDKSVDAELKKSAAMEFFTEPRTARSYIQRASTGFDKEDKIIANAAVDEAFGDPTLPFQKLYWDRLDTRWYKFTAVKRDGFRFGSDIIWEYCDAITATKGNVSHDNKFLDQFK